jgi:hypothetical protein
LEADTAPPAASLSGGVAVTVGNEKTIGKLPMVIVPL